MVPFQISEQKHQVCCCCCCCFCVVCLYLVFDYILRGDCQGRTQNFPKGGGGGGGVGGVAGSPLPGWTSCTSWSDMIIPIHTCTCESHYYYVGKPKQRRRAGENVRPNPPPPPPDSWPPAPVPDWRGSQIASSQCFLALLLNWGWTICSILSSPINCLAYIFAITSIPVVCLGKGWLLTTLSTLCCFNWP